MENLKKELEEKVQSWVDRSFNFIQLSVFDKCTYGNLHEKIRPLDSADCFLDWLLEYDLFSKLSEYKASDSDLDFDLENLDVDYQKTHLSLDLFLIEKIGEDNYDGFKDWCFQEYDDDIYDYVNAKENYPCWNTLFEFRDSYFNENEEKIQKCIEAGFGIIEDCEDFNTTLFVGGAGYSFYAQHWIPLYLSLYPMEAEKYKGINYSDL